MPNVFKQKTIANTISCKGVGVHSGKTVNMTILPAPVNHGIKFVRVDLPDKPSILAHFNMVKDTSLATVIGSEGAIVSTIEHIMSCFAGMGIDNAIVEIDDYEVPIMDGSARLFVEMIKKTGIYKQDKAKFFFIVKKPIELKEKDKSVCVYPAPFLKITYTIEFEHNIIGAQTYAVKLSPETFEKDIASARTFGFYKDFETLKRYGFAKGGSLDNAVVISEEGTLNKEGLRFKDEFVRHKILDCIGDFALIGLPIIGHIKLHKSGHAFNHTFLKKFFKEKDCWETSEFRNIQL
jgi:UDP-3-O-[3-hydroxymyristoyl] N-acetylglucosamine deacetylase